MNGERSYRVVVVEDELPILENLVQKIKASGLPFTVAGQARDGESGLELVSRVQPHLLITDIRMPVMDGLRLVERATELFPNLKILIVSGYDDFSYAQQAMRFGASDYLLKPVSSVKLNGILQKIHEELEKTGQRREREIVTSGLAGNTGQTDLPSGFGHRRYGMHLVVVGNLVEDNHISLQKRSDQYWKKVDLHALVEQISGSEASLWMVDEPSLNGKMLINALPCALFGNLLFKRLVEKSGGMFPVTVCSAVEEVPADQIWHTARRLRVHIQEKLRPCLNSHVLAGEEISAVTFLLDKDGCKALGVLAKAKKTEALSTEVHALVAQWKAEELTQKCLREYCRAALKAIDEACDNMSEWKEAQLEAERIIEESVNADSLYDELKALFDGYVEVNCQPNKTAQELFERVRQYIDEHYREPITVGSIADDFHFSPSYITRVFKKYAHQPPLKYLLELRISEAKRLIDQDAGLSFQTISEIVGFADPHYFSRVFRSITGMSPSAYRKK